jgi:hypothetical protein
MPNPPSCPVLIDQCKNVSISFLKQHGYLNKNKVKSGVITWSNQYEKTGSISIFTDIDNEDGYLELDYKSSQKSINYKVRLVTIQSNLGKGVIWYFICSRTGKRCKKLHLIDGYFYHRSAFSGCMYDKQTESKKNRFSGKLFDKWQAAYNASKEIRRKHFKKQYNGKPTRLYLKYLQQIDAGQGIGLEALLMI